jgi:hypothetical protein
MSHLTFLNVNHGLMALLVLAVHTDAMGELALANSLQVLQDPVPAVPAAHV